jgi:hypothetical protein
MEAFWENIPTWDNGKWTTTSFATRDEFRVFLLTIFKEPGQYNFNEDSNKIFNQQAQIFKSTNIYCAAPFKSKDFINYWDDQKLKCRNGVLVKSGKETWYLAREYYMWLNFLPIFNKEIQAFGFADIRDAQ